MIEGLSRSATTTIKVNKHTVWFASNAHLPRTSTHTYLCSCSVIISLTKRTKMIYNAYCTFKYTFSGTGMKLTKTLTYIKYLQTIGYLLH